MYLDSMNLPPLQKKKRKRNPNTGIRVLYGRSDMHRQFAIQNWYPCVQVLYACNL